jgi:hypothetical protein
MDTAAQYREYARECAQWAADAHTDEARSIFLQIAQQWIEAALTLERIEGSPPTPSERPLSARH